MTVRPADIVEVALAENQWIRNMNLIAHWWHVEELQPDLRPFSYRVWEAGEKSDYLTADTVTIHIIVYLMLFNQVGMNILHKENKFF